jgi:hypothetical protein
VTRGDAEVTPIGPRGVGGRMRVRLVRPHRDNAIVFAATSPLLDGIGGVYLNNNDVSS